MAEIIKRKMERTLESGGPVALYDNERKRPYKLYPDGRRVYDVE